MEKHEFTFKGLTINGFVALLANLLLTVAAIAAIVYSIINFDYVDITLPLVSGIVILIASFFVWGGFMELEPGEARVVMFFGKYKGTFTRAGYYWINPFTSTKKLSLRARSLDASPIKVNDKSGNPILIGMVLVWRLNDTYKAMFDIDSQTMASSANQVSVSGTAVHFMKAIEQFVCTQSDAALRLVASKYPYDTDNNHDSLSLRDGSEEINKELEEKIDERLAMAGIEVVEARINYLAYAPEIAAVMLRRQQADAIIAAREKIVEGAVSMVKMAIDRISADDIVDLDDDKKAAMVSNLLVVLCGDDAAQPVVNTGTLNM